MRDFSLHTYSELLTALQAKGYETLSFEQYCRRRFVEGKSLPERYVILRHDVDKRPGYAWQMAQEEAALGVSSSYYFRIVPESNVPSVIRQIALLRHEIGYHYEDVALTGGDMEKAYTHFCDSLEYFRQFYPVSTCCMHGSPLSKYDNRSLWEHHDYHILGLLGEPYFDVDFSEVFYLTDTGRCWDGYRYSVRDKVPKYQSEWLRQGLQFHSTGDLLRALEEDRLPHALMITTHPQRWTNGVLAWGAEVFAQKTKNIVKAVLVRRHG